MEKLKSRKFWIAVTTAALVIVNEGLGLGIPEDAVMQIVAVALTYILGQAGVDIVKAKNGKS